MINVKYFDVLYILSLLIFMLLIIILLLFFFRTVARLGDLNLDPNVNDGANPIDIQIERIMTHERYNAQEYTNDIALLKLGNNARFDRKFGFLISIFSEQRFY